MPNKVVIGIDQSYTRTGFSIVVDGELKEWGSIDFDKKEPNAKKRFRLKRLIQVLLGRYGMADDLMIITERDNSKHRLVIKNSAELTATIVDEALHFHVPVYSVVASSWKSKVLPKKFGKPADYDKEEYRNPNKMPQIRYCEEVLGIDVKEYKNSEIKLDKKGRICYNDDICDAVGIGLYGFVDAKLQKLQKEE